MPSYFYLKLYDLLIEFKAKICYNVNSNKYKEKEL